MKLQKKRAISFVKKDCYMKKSLIHFIVFIISPTIFVAFANENNVLNKHFLSKNIEALHLRNNNNQYRILEESTKDSKNKWFGHIDLNLKVSSERNLAQSSFFLPISQNSQALTYLNVIAMGSDNNSFEGNVGIGVRKIFDDKVILGSYFFLDVRKSEYGNRLNQMTAGFEILSHEWDVRGNFYLPEEEAFLISSNGSARLSENAIYETNNYELTMRGSDFEIGHSVFTPKIRAYVGGYYFYSDKLTTSNKDVIDKQSFTGTRARLVITPWDFLRIELESQKDEAREDNHFFGIRLTIGFGGKKQTAPNSLEKRMTEPVIRDIDIVALPTDAKEKQVLAANGKNQKIYFVNNELSASGDGTYENPYKTLAEAESATASYDIIYVYKGDGTISGQNSGITLKDNQKLYGQGTDFIVNNSVLIAASGYSKITNTDPGSSLYVANGSVSQTNKTTGIKLANNNEISGIEVSKIARGVSINGVGTTGLYLHDSNIEPSSFLLIYNNQQTNISSLQNNLYDVLMVNLATVGDVSDNLTSTQITGLQSQGKKILAYLSIGEIGSSVATANGWNDSNPANFFLRKASDNSLYKNTSFGSYFVNPDNAEFLTYAKNKLNIIINSGYDGVMLDTVDSHISLSNQAISTGLNDISGSAISAIATSNAGSMRSLIMNLSTVAKASNSDFMIIPNGGMPSNSAGLLADSFVDGTNNLTPTGIHTDYINAIDGTLKESVFYLNDTVRSVTDQNYATEMLDLVTGAGKPVFILDFPTNNSNRCTMLTNADDKGYNAYPTSDSAFNSIYSYPTSCP